MVSRAIYCDDCEPEVTALFRVAKQYNEPHKRVDLTLRVECRCDCCNKALKHGDRVIALAYAPRWRSLGDGRWIDSYGVQDA